LHDYVTTRGEESLPGDKHPDSSSLLGVPRLNTATRFENYLFSLLLVLEFLVFERRPMPQIVMVLVRFYLPATGQYHKAIGIKPCSLSKEVCPWRAWQIQRE